MGDWIRRIRESAALEDGSLLFQAAAQAMAAIDRSRDRWGERGIPYWLRAAGPAPESEWVWFGQAVREACADQNDLNIRPALLAFRIRDDSPMEAAMRADRFRVAWTLPADHDIHWLEPSGEPYLARPGEQLLEFAFRDWERDLERRWRATSDPEPRGLFGRKQKARRRKRERLYRAINEERRSQYLRLIHAAYAPDAAFEARLAQLVRSERHAVLAALTGQRAPLVTDAEPGGSDTGRSGEGRAAG